MTYFSHSTMLLKIEEAGRYEEPLKKLTFILPTNSARPNSDESLVTSQVV